MTLSRTVCRGVISASLVLTMLVMPVANNLVAASALPPQEGNSACADAEARAKADVSGSTWFIIGCLGGVLGWIIAEVVDSNPPATALIGKDEVYVATYSECYKKQAKGIKTKQAIAGCLAGTVASLALYAVLLATAPSE